MRIISRISLIVAICLLPVCVQAQLNGGKGPLLRAGVLKLELESVLDTDDVAPVVTEDEGIIRIILDASTRNYFDSADVVRWLRDGQFQIYLVQFRAENVHRRNDGSVTVRFNFKFLRNVEKIVRHVQIDNVGPFETYFNKTHEFYKRKMVVYRLSVEKEPVYDVPRLASVLFKANQPNFNIDMTDENNAVRRYTVTGYDSTFTNIPPGRQSMLFTKNNFEEIRMARHFTTDSLYTVEIDFRRIPMVPVPVVEAPRKSRWWVWTLVGAAVTSGTAWYLLKPGGTPPLPGPPAPPPSN